MSASDGLFYGATAYVLAKAFASGGSAVTGVEAISNGVPAFQEPAWKHARQTLVVMGVGLGVMFLGLSALASKIEGAAVRGGHAHRARPGRRGGLRHRRQSARSSASRSRPPRCSSSCWPPTPASPTSRAWPASRPATASSRASSPSAATGWCSRTGSSPWPAPPPSSSSLTNAAVTRLIPLYAIGVFVGFTLSQAGMTKHHLRLKEPGWKTSLAPQRRRRRHLRLRGRDRAHHALRRRLADARS